MVIDILINLFFSIYFQWDFRAKKKLLKHLYHQPQTHLKLFLKFRGHDLNSSHSKTTIVLNDCKLCVMIEYQKIIVIVIVSDKLYRIPFKYFWPMSKTHLSCTSRILSKTFLNTSIIKKTSWWIIRKHFVF